MAVSGPRRSGTSARSVTVDETRLNSFLAQCGVASRRGAEQFITAGRIRVNGITVADLSTKVKPSDVVTLDGVVVSPDKVRAYYVLNKPRGVVSTASDPQGRTTVVDLVPKVHRVFPVGRLDVDSEGLVLLTNDGELAFRLTHPSTGVGKTYQITVEGRLNRGETDALVRGITVDGVSMRAAQARVVEHANDTTRLIVTLEEGRKRQLRLMFAQLGHQVVSLVRLSIGPLGLGGLPTGEWREVGGNELRALRKAAGLRHTRG